MGKNLLTTISHSFKSPPPIGIHTDSLTGDRKLLRKDGYADLGPTPPHARSLSQARRSTHQGRDKR